MSTDLPTSMRAWQRIKRGPYNKGLRLNEHHPMPPMPGPASNDVLVQISYVALEFSMLTLFTLIPGPPFWPQLIPELEFSGTVIRAGSRVPSNLQARGTRVMGFQSLPSLFLLGKGVLAEYITVPADQLTQIPDRAVRMDQAAGLIGCGATARKMVRTAHVQQGQRVLVHGASGSVGNLVVQMCRRRGAFVVGVASGRNEEMVRTCGADEFIDYTQHVSLTAHLASTYGERPFDWILDCVGSQSLYVNSPTYLSAKGAVINVGAMQDGVVTQLWNWFLNSWRPTWLGGVPRQYIMFSTPLASEDAVVLLQMAAEGEIKVLLDSTWDMDNALEAYGRMDTKRARGKVVVKVRAD